jgi:hypothetical protein
MTVQEILSHCAVLGVTLAPSGGGKLRVSPPGVLPEELRARLQRHKIALLRLPTAAPADCLSEEPCTICSSHERWIWLDGRLLCRVCVILDQAPLTLARQGRPGNGEEATHG